MNCRSNLTQLFGRKWFNLSDVAGFFPPDESCVESPYAADLNHPMMPFGTAHPDTALMDKEKFDEAAERTGAFTRSSWPQAVSLGEALEIRDWFDMQPAATTTKIIYGKKYFWAKSGDVLNFEDGTSYRMNEFGQVLLTPSPS